MKNIVILLSVLTLAVFLGLEVPHLPRALLGDECLPHAQNTSYPSLALVCGASSGVGRQWAERLASRGFDLILFARREDKLKEIATFIVKEYNVSVTIHAVDAVSDEGVTLLKNILNGERTIGFFVYNVVSSHAGELLSKTLPQLREVVDVNVMGAVTYSRLVAEHMAKRCSDGQCRGAIVLMSSVVHMHGVGTLSSYAASKAWTTSFAEALWIELGTVNIDVLGVNAGLILSESIVAYRKNHTTGSGSYDFTGQDPKDIVEEAMCALGAVPSFHSGLINKLSYFALNRLLPTKISISILTDAAKNA
eukprot:m.343542 g.343542  ORF g.343542 m.343542 type:complete len:307 (+) comp22976_c0_seq1:85-1005(+)